MSYTHQKEVFQIFGTGANNTFVILASGTGIKGRHTFTGHSYIMRKLTVKSNVIGVTVGKPIFTLRKATAPCTTTASGTAFAASTNALNGAVTLSIPASQAAGKAFTCNTSRYQFNPGDAFVLHVSTAATKAMACQAWIEAEPIWESAANITTGATTVTA